MAMEPSQKRFKKDQLDPIFYQFRKDQAKIDLLTQTCNSLRWGLNFMKLRALRLEECWARSSSNFKSAKVKTSLIKLESETGVKSKIPAIFNLSKIFKPAVVILESYLLEEKPQLPVDELERRALAQLLKYLSQGLENAALLQEKDYSGNEGEWALILSQHLLSPLAVARSYITDSYKGYSTTVCPCEEKDSLLGTQGDTSFGCSSGWHGRVDILMEGVPVGLNLGADLEDSESESISFATEMNTCKGFTENNKIQIQNEIIAQTIVFSFLQRKISKGAEKNVLIPGIGISANQVIVYFYDSEEDVLLNTHPYHLFLACDGKKVMLEVDTVVVLWLTLNYKVFCSGVDDNMKKYKAEFFQRVGDFLDVYKNEVDKPMHVNEASSEESLHSWNFRDPEGTSFNCEVDLIELLPE